MRRPGTGPSSTAGFTYSRSRAAISLAPMVNPGTAVFQNWFSAIPFASGAAGGVGVVAAGGITAGRVSATSGGIGRVEAGASNGLSLDEDCPLEGGVVEPLPASPLPIHSMDWMPERPAWVV